MTFIPPRLALRMAAIRADLKIEDDDEARTCTVLGAGIPMFRVGIAVAHERIGEEWVPCSVARALDEVDKIGRIKKLARMTRVSQ